MLLQEKKKNLSHTSHQFVGILSWYNSISVDCLSGMVVKYQMSLTDEHRYFKGIIGDTVLDSGSFPLPWIYNLIVTDLLILSWFNFLESQWAVNWY